MYYMNSTTDGVFIYPGQSNIIPQIADQIKHFFEGQIDVLCGLNELPCHILRQFCLDPETDPAFRRMMLPVFPSVMT